MRRAPTRRPSSVSPFATVMSAIPRYPSALIALAARPGEIVGSAGLGLELLALDENLVIWPLRQRQPRLRRGDGQDRSPQRSRRAPSRPPAQIARDILVVRHARRPLLAASGLCRLSVVAEIAGRMTLTSPTLLCCSCGVLGCLGRFAPARQRPTACGSAAPGRQRLGIFPRAAGGLAGVTMRPMTLACSSSLPASGMLRSSLARLRSRRISFSTNGRA